MCFEVDTAIKTCKRRIVYKVLQRVGVSYARSKEAWASPFGHEFTWKKGDEMTAGNFEPTYECDHTGRTNAKAGVYVFLTLKDAKEAAYAWGDKTHKVFKCSVRPHDFLFQAKYRNNEAAYRRVKLLGRVDKTRVWTCAKPA